MLRPSEKGIDYAITKLSDFVKVHKTSSMEKKLDAVDHFAEAVGLDGPRYDHLVKKLTQIVDSPGGELGWAVIGTIVGLYILEHASDEQERNLSI